MDRENRRNFLQRLSNWTKKFGHSRKIIGYIHLMHWFQGEFFYSKDLNRKFTRFWIILSLSSNVIYLLIVTSYVFFTPNPGTTNILYSYNAIMVDIYLVILIPSISYICGTRTTQTFKILDQRFTPFPPNGNIFQEYPSQVQFIKHGEYSMKIVYNLLIFHFASYLGYFIATTLYFVTGNSQNKLHDPVSYLYPIYCQMVPNLVVLFFINGILFFIVIPHMIINMLEPFYIILIAKEFYSKFLLVSNSIKNQSILYIHRYERLLMDHGCSQEEKNILQETFLRDIRTYVKCHEQLLKSISYFKPLLELTTSVCIIVLMSLEVVLLYIYIYAEDDSLMFKMKNMNYGLLFYSLFFVVCLTGKLFSDMEDLFVETIYDVPWYYLSSSNRKFVHLLLSQAHVQKKFKALNVYTINMNFFLRYTQQVYSVANLLNRATKK